MPDQQTTMDIVWLSPHDLVPYEKNTKTHPPEQVDAIARQIREHGFDQPIVLDGKGQGGLEIIKGHGRRLASISLGLAKVPCVIRSDLSRAQVRAMRIADNKVAESPWEMPALKFELGELASIEGFDMGLTGFTVEEATDLLKPPPEPDLARDEALQSLAAKFGAVPFSVLRAAEGWWQDRKRAWIALGIESEVGRGENLLQFSEGMLTGYADQRRGDTPPGESTSIKGALTVGISMQAYGQNEKKKAKRPAVPGNGKQPSSGAHADMAYMKKKNAQKGKAK